MNGTADGGRTSCCGVRYIGGVDGEDPRVPRQRLHRRPARPVLQAQQVRVPLDRRTAAGRGVTDELRPARRTLPVPGPTCPRSHLTLVLPDQHAGLYLLLVVGIVVCVLLMFAEHAIFKWMVSYWRRKPNKSFWKSPSMMFWSQVRRARRRACVMSLQVTQHLKVVILSYTT